MLGVSSGRPDPGEGASAPAQNTSSCSSSAASTATDTTHSGKRKTLVFWLHVSGRASERRELFLPGRPEGWFSLSLCGELENSLRSSSRLGLADLFLGRAVREDRGETPAWGARVEEWTGGAKIKDCTGGARIEEWTGGARIEGCTVGER